MAEPVNQNVPAVREAPGELSVAEVVDQVTKIQELMKIAMHPGEHYGVIPGTGNKPSLFKAGAEKLLLMFRFGPEYATETIREGRHLTITSTCTLKHIPSSRWVGSGMGSCSTMEQKYAFRQQGRKCPKCGLENIRKSKNSPGYYCWDKTGGCGTNFTTPAAMKEIEEQVVGQMDNPYLADQYNVVLKMSNKRALVAAVLNATAASDIFTQDLEDLTQARQAFAVEAEDAEVIDTSTSQVEPDYIAPQAKTQKPQTATSAPKSPKPAPPPPPPEAAAEVVEPVAPKAKPAPKAARPGTIGEAKAAVLRAKCEQARANPAVICSMNGVKELEDLRLEDFDVANMTLDNMIARKAKEGQARRGENHNV